MAARGQRTAVSPATVAGRRGIRPVVWTGLAIGVGLIGALDEIIFHQILQWHNFYVHTTLAWRIRSDGFFHIFSSAMLLLGAALLWRQREKLRTRGETQRLAAAVLWGMGGFNLYDGTIQHKLLKLHPIREGVANQLPYDLAWNGAALLLILLGWLLWRRTRAHAG
jgi:uncharacterized membrane protein